MYRKAVKYFFLVLFAALALANLIPFGDYSSGLANGLLMLLFTSIFAFLSLVVLIDNITGYLRHKIRFDWIPVVIMAVFVLLYALTINSEGNKFWTLVILEADNEHTDRPHNSSLILYKNHSFIATEVLTDFAMHYSGNYTINSDTLYLDRKDISEKTGGMLTTQYYVDKKNNMLIPVDSRYKPLFVLK